MTISELRSWLEEHDAAFELIYEEKPILSAKDAEGRYDPALAAPALILQTEHGLMLLILSARRGRVDLEALRQKLGLETLKMANPKRVERETGYAVGAVPLVGLNLPCVFDDDLLTLPFIYGGSGDPCVTLKIAPADVRRAHLAHLLPCAL